MTKRDQTILARLAGRLERQQARAMRDLKDEVTWLVSQAISKEFAKISVTSPDPAQMLDTARALVIALKQRCEMAEDVNLRRAAEVKRK